MQVIWRGYSLLHISSAFVAIVFLFLLACFVLAADPFAKLRLATLSDEYSERTINSPGGSRGFRIFDFDPTFRAA